MDSVQANDAILLLWDNSYDVQSSEFKADQLKEKFNATINYENVDRLDLASYANSLFTLAILKVNEKNDTAFLAKVLKVLTPKGRIVADSPKPDELSGNLKLSGYINVSINGNSEFCKFCPGHEPKLESKDIKILDREKNEFKRKMMEAYYINIYDSKANNYKRDARRMNENYSNIINIYKNINNS